MQTLHSYSQQGTVSQIGPNNSNLCLSVWRGWKKPLLGYPQALVYSSAGNKVGLHWWSGKVPEGVTMTAIPRMRGQSCCLPGAPVVEEQGQEEQGGGKEHAWESKLLWRTGIWSFGSLHQDTLAARQGAMALASAPFPLFSTPFPLFSINGSVLPPARGAEDHRGPQS